MGLSRSALTRYILLRPSRRSLTNPTCFNTPRCFDTIGWVQPSFLTISLTDSSFVSSASRTCRRLGSATALNGSWVVGVRAMTVLYSYIGICQWAYFRIGVLFCQEGKCADFGYRHQPYRPLRGLIHIKSHRHPRFKMVILEVRSFPASQTIRDLQ